MKFPKFSRKQIAAGLTIFTLLSISLLAISRHYRWEIQGETDLYERQTHTLYLFENTADRDYFHKTLFWGKSFQTDTGESRLIYRESDFLIKTVTAREEEQEMHYSVKVLGGTSTISYVVPQGQQGNLILKIEYTETNQTFSDGKRTFSYRSQVPTDESYIEPIYWDIED